MSLSTNEVSPIGAHLTRNRASIVTVVYNWIDIHFDQRRNASKKLARMASHGDHQVSHRTAERWIRKERAPCVESIMVMAARCDDLAAQIEQQRERLRAQMAP